MGVHLCIHAYWLENEMGSSHSVTQCYKDNRNFFSYESSLWVFPLPFLWRHSKVKWNTLYCQVTRSVSSCCFFKKTYKTFFLVFSCSEMDSSSVTGNGYTFRIFLLSFSWSVHLIYMNLIYIMLDWHSSLLAMGLAATNGLSDIWVRFFFPFVPEKMRNIGAVITEWHPICCVATLVAQGLTLVLQLDLVNPVT